LSVGLFACLSQADIVSKRLSGSICDRTYPQAYPALCSKGIRVFSKMRIRLCATLSQTSFKTPKLGKFSHGALIVEGFFLQRDAMIARYMLWPCVRLCLSVRLRLSVTSRCSTRMAEHRITQTKPHDSTGTLVFCRQRSPRNSTGVTPYGGAKCRRGWLKSATFDE